MVLSISSLSHEIFLLIRWFFVLFQPCTSSCVHNMQYMSNIITFIQNISYTYFISLHSPSYLVIFTSYGITYTHHIWWESCYISSHLVSAHTRTILDDTSITYARCGSSVLIKSCLAWYFCHFLIPVSHTTGSSY